MNPCVCMAGWHFQRDLIQTLQAISDLQLFILSHKPRTAIPEWLDKVVPEEYIYFENNLGYDWGAYQQFIDKKIWKDFDTIFFMHDDITLLDKSVFHNCYELTQSLRENCIIGNGRVSTKRDWPLTHIQSYAHSLWKPPSWDFEHDTVRGSFFAISKPALERIGNLEILWDRRRLYGIGAGNYSLRATCGKIQQILGKDSFQYLSESYRHSPYLIEMERGQEQTQRTDLPFRQKITQAFLGKFSKILMTWYMNATPAYKKTLAWSMQSIFGIL